jgi:hypothetical protein
MTIDRQAQLKKLYEVILAIYTKRKDSHPEVAAKFHVDHFLARSKGDPYFDDVLQMEIEDCSRALA